MPRDDELDPRERHDHERAEAILEDPKHHEPPPDKEPRPNDIPDEPVQPERDAR